MQQASCHVDRLGGPISVLRIEQGNKDGDSPFEIILAMRWARDNSSSSHVTYWHKSLPMMRVFQNRPFTFATIVQGPWQGLASFGMGTTP